MSAVPYKTALQQTELADTLQQARKHYVQRIEQLQAELSTTRSLLSDYGSTLQQLTSLPSQFRPRHRVAFGPLAFFPNGHLQHPSEVLLLLGSGYFLQCTTERGRDVCRRRMQTLREKEDRCIAEEKRVRERLEYGDSITGRTTAAAGEEAADDIVEIKEEYREEEEQHRAAVSAPPDDGRKEERTAASVGAGAAAAGGGPGMSEEEFNAYWDRLAELEAEEEQREQQQAQRAQRRPRQQAAEEVKGEREREEEAEAEQTAAEGEAEAEEDAGVALPAIHSPADIYKQIKTRRELHGVSGEGSSGAAQAAPSPSPSSSSAAAEARGAVKQREKRVSFSSKPSVAVIDPVSTRPLRHHAHSPPPPASSFLPHSSPSPSSPPSPPPEPPAPAFSGAVRERLVEERNSPSVTAPVPVKKMSRFMAERLGLQSDDD